MNATEELSEIRNILLRAGAPDIGGSTLDLVKLLVGPAGKVMLRQRPEGVAEETLESIEALQSLSHLSFSEDMEKAMLALPSLVDEVRAHRLFRGLCIRPAVRRFAQVMEGELTENDHKGGWEKTPVNVLLGHLCEEVAEVVESIEFGPRGVLTPFFRTRAEYFRQIAKDFVAVGPVWQAKATAETASEAGDVGNMALMVVDRLGALSETPGKTIGSRPW